MFNIDVAASTERSASLSLLCCCIAVFLFCIITQHYLNQSGGMKPLAGTCYCLTCLCKCLSLKKWRPVIFKNKQTKDFSPELIHISRSGEYFKYAACGFERTCRQEQQCDSFSFLNSSWLRSKDHATEEWVMSCSKPWIHSQGLLTGTNV